MPNFLKLTQLAFLGWKIGTTAQSVKATSVKETLEKILQTHTAISPSTTPQDAATATRYALRILCRTGKLDSCIIEAMILANLLRSSGTCRFHIGFRDNPTMKDPDGHAWASLDGEIIEARGSSLATGHSLPYKEITRFLLPKDNSHHVDIENPD